MAKIDAWAATGSQGTTWVQQADRGYDTARRIAERPTTIVVTRNGAQLAAQIVRIDPLEGRPTETPVMSGGSEADMRVLVMGYRSTNGVTDTDLQRGDTFVTVPATYLYEVIEPVPGTGDRLLVVAEVSE